MTRDQLEHVIRASAAIAGVEDIVVIGSQAILGWFTDAPEELLVYQEADVYARLHPEFSHLIDGTIGEGCSPVWTQPKPMPRFVRLP